MAFPARALPPSEPGGDETHVIPVGSKLPPGLPVLLNVRDLAHSELRYVDAEATPVAQSPAMGAGANKKREGDVLRGIKDLQQLQKQTIAVLEALKGSLDDIQQVLRSPEATRGMEKQQNAVMLLAKGFAREAVEQSQGAVTLLPANPDAHLLLALSLAADQQFDPSLTAARKGLALFDRRSHPLAIEAGLLHALAALGCGAEAVERWQEIIEGLALPVLFEHLGRIAACFPTEESGGGEALLDDVVNRRLARDEEQAVEAESAVDGGRKRPREGKIAIRADEIPAPALFAGLDAAKDYRLLKTHRAILRQLARRLQLVREAGDTLKFLTECVIPLGNRDLERTTAALGRAAVRRLLRLHADAMTLFRAMGKLEMAGANVAVREIALLLDHWRREGSRVARAKASLRMSYVLLAAGAGAFSWAFYYGATRTLCVVAGQEIPAVGLGPALMALGAVMGIVGMCHRTWQVILPDGRWALTREELAFIRTAEVRQALRGVHQRWAAEG